MPPHSRTADPPALDPLGLPALTLPLGEFPAGPASTSASRPLALPVPLAMPSALDWTQRKNAQNPNIQDLPTAHGLDELLRQVTQDDRNKWDLPVPRERLALADGRLLLPEEYAGEYPESLMLSPWATAQACRRLGIPTPYFLRCPRPLRDAQFNHWAWSQDAEPDEDGARPGSLRPWLLRCQDERVRAVLSDRYAPLDNADLLGTLVPLLEGRFEVRGIALTGESLHLRLVDPRLTREVLPDDRLLAGVHIANSEIGKRSVTVDALVWRLVCLNGLVMLVKGRSLLRQRHVAWDRPRFADALRTAVSEAVMTGAGLIDRLKAATSDPVPDVEGVVRAIARQASLTQAVQEQVLAALRATPPPQQERVYGLVQALTFAAQSLPPDDRYDLEVTAGRLLDAGVPAPLKADAPARTTRRVSGGDDHAFD